MSSPLWKKRGRGDFGSWVWEDQFFHSFPLREGEGISFSFLSPGKRMKLRVLWRDRGCVAKATGSGWIWLGCFDVRLFCSHPKPTTRDLKLNRRPARPCIPQPAVPPRPPPRASLQTCAADGLAKLSALTPRSSPRILRGTSLWRPCLRSHCLAQRA